MKHRINALLISAALLTSCSGKGSSAEPQPFTFTIHNLTGVDIASVYIAPENDRTGYSDCLGETLRADSDKDIDLGALSDEVTAKGFLLEVTSAEDGSSANFSQLHISRGSVVTFYLDDLGLAVLVDATDDEVREEISRVHEDFTTEEADSISQ